MEKQIEEMARIIFKGEIDHAVGDLDCSECPCDMRKKFGIRTYAGAKALYNAGYRKQEWHKVSDELPETSGSYIICTKNGSVCTAHFYADWGRFTSPAGRNAVYWTYLPKPPKGE